MVRVQVTWRGAKKEPVFIDLKSGATLDDLKEAFAKKYPKYYASRQRFTLPPSTPGGRREPLKDGKLPDAVSVEFKDLGPQIAWRTVFLAEYAGPLVLYALSAFVPGLIYGQGAIGAAAAHRAQMAAGMPTDTLSTLFHPASTFLSTPLLPCGTPVQRLALLLHTLHYAKRLLETVFVHRFSNGTMPLGNLFKNCWYYWFFGGALGFAVNHPLYTQPPAAWAAAGAVAFLLAELGNLHCHLVLRWLRPAGSKVRRIPRGAWFSLVSCPNYTFEIAAWAAFTAATWTVAGAAFLFVGAAQMTVWALKKHRNYRKEFKDYPRVRKAIFPFLI